MDFYEGVVLNYLRGDLGPKDGLRGSFPSLRQWSSSRIVTPNVLMKFVARWPARLAQPTPPKTPLERATRADGSDPPRT